MFNPLSWLLSTTPNRCVHVLIGKEIHHTTNCTENNQPAQHDAEVVIGRSQSVTRVDTAKTNAISALVKRIEAMERTQAEQKSILESHEEMLNNIYRDAVIEGAKGGALCAGMFGGAMTAYQVAPIVYDAGKIAFGVTTGDPTSVYNGACNLVCNPQVQQQVGKVLAVGIAGAAFGGAMGGIRAHFAHKETTNQENK